MQLCFLAVIAVVHGYGGFGFFPIPLAFPYGFPVSYPAEDVYAASLGGASVGLYGKSHPFGSLFPGFPGYFGGSSDVNAASLGGAPVGLYEKERYY